MTVAPFTFNLWREPWIRATRREDGASVELNIGDCLREAHTLAALHDPSPLVVAGTHRLLTAILQAIYAPKSLGELQTLLAAKAFDPAKLENFVAQYGERFDLFHPSAPFLQTGDVPLDGWRKPEKGQKDDWSEPKPIAVLFAEIPAATNRSHFHHVTDTNHHMCPACCARGLITVPAFASSGGPGIRPSINGVPPIYVFPAGSSLFESLVLSLVNPNYQPPGADTRRHMMSSWNGPTVTGKNAQVSAVGYLESLTFPARRMRLYASNTVCACTHCGVASQIVVDSLLFEMGHWLSEGSGLWEDPFAAFRKPRGSAKRDDATLKPVRPEGGKALWREYSGLLLAEDKEHGRPRIVQQVGALVDRNALPEVQSLRFRCIGIRTDGKAKIFEWLDETLAVPAALLVNPYSAESVDKALEWADQVRFILESVFDRHFRPERDEGGSNAKLVRFKTVRARMTATYWQQLAEPFRRFVTDLADDAALETTERGWVDTLVKEGKRVFDQAADQVGSRAEALRARVKAQAACSGRLGAKRKEWIHE